MTRRVIATKCNSVTAQPQRFAPRSKPSRNGLPTQKRCPLGACINTGLLARHDPRAEALQPRDLRLDRVGLDVEMGPGIMVDPLDDDLHLARRGHELDVAAADIHVLGQRVTEGRTPEARLREKVVGAAIDDDVAQSAAMHARFRQDLAILRQPARQAAPHR